MLFPLVRESEAGANDGLHRNDLAGPIQQMESEHEAAGQLTARLRGHTDGFTPNAEACWLASRNSSRTCIVTCIRRTMSFFRGPSLVLPPDAD